jgi:hypothetical protein
MAIVCFEPIGEEIECEEHETVLDADTYDRFRSSVSE